MTSHLIHNEVLGRPIRKGGWTELAEGTPRLVRRALEAGDDAGAAELADFLLAEFRVVFDIYSVWFPQTRRYLIDKGMTAEVVESRFADNRNRLSTWHKTASRPREQVFAEIEAAIEGVKDATQPYSTRHASLDLACETWRDLHDGEVDQLTGLFHIVVTEFGEPALREMYEGWVIGDWFGKRYQRFDVSKISWETAAWLLTYLGFEGQQGHLSGAARDGTIDCAEDDEKVTLSFAPCGSGGRTLQGEVRDGLPALSSSAIGWGELRDAHDFTWGKTGVCAYCAHCCVIHENLSIAAFGYPVRVTEPPTAPLTAESRCSWTIYKDLRAIPASVYERVGAVKPPASAPLGSAGKAERDSMLASGTGDA